MNLSKFFIKNNKFKINSLISIYNIFEFVCWDEIKNNLNEEYKMKIEEKDKVKIINYINLNMKEDNLVTKKDISTALRRLISRYLCGKRGDTDINEYKRLSDYILREDLWRKQLQNDNNIDNFQSIINSFFKEIDLSIGHSLELYELLSKIK